MVCNAPASAPDALTPYDLFEAADTRLYHLQHVCGLLGDFAGQQGSRKFTDGLQLERFAVVFGFIGDEIQTAREQFGHARHLIQGEKSC